MADNNSNDIPNDYELALSEGLYLNQFEREGSLVRDFSSWLMNVLDVYDLTVDSFVDMVGKPFSVDDFWNLVNMYTPEGNLYAPDDNLIYRIAEVLDITEKNTLNELNKLATWARSTRSVQIISFPQENISNKVTRSVSANNTLSKEENLVYYKKLIAARNEFYQALSTATNGKISSPEDYSELTGMNIAFSRGLRPAHIKELEKAYNNDFASLSVFSGDRTLLNTLTGNFFTMVRQPPPVRKNEISAEAYSYINVGHNQALNKRFHRLRMLEIENRIKDGIDPAQVELEVDDTIFGMRKSVNGSYVLYATPKGIQIYEKDRQSMKVASGYVSAHKYSKDNNEVYRAVLTGWQIVHQLTIEQARKDKTTGSIDIKNIRRTVEVDERLFARRGYRIYASPEGIEAWKEWIRTKKIPDLFRNRATTKKKSVSKVIGGGYVSASEYSKDNNEVYNTLKRNWRMLRQQAIEEAVKQACKDKTTGFIDINEVRRIAEEDKTLFAIHNGKIYASLKGIEAWKEYQRPMIKGGGYVSAYKYSLNNSDSHNHNYVTKGWRMLRQQAIEQAVEQAVEQARKGGTAYLIDINEIRKIAVKDETLFAIRDNRTYASLKGIEVWKQYKQPLIKGGGYVSANKYCLDKGKDHKTVTKGWKKVRQQAIEQAIEQARKDDTSGFIDINEIRRIAEKDETLFAVRYKAIYASHEGIEEWKEWMAAKKDPNFFRNKAITTNKEFVSQVTASIGR